MVHPAGRGGIRSVVEGYARDGFLAGQDVRLVASYVDGGFARRQVVLARALARFVALLASGRVELVHLHAAARGSFWRKTLFARLARARGVPVLLHLHGSEMRGFYERQPAPLRAAIRRELTAATRVLVLSPRWADFVGRIAPAARTVVVPNCVPLPESPPARPARPDAPLTLLFLGRVGARKGVPDLLDALARIRSRPTGPALRLVIGGDGEVEAARARAEALGLGESVAFAGWVGPEARAALLAGADLYVLPSRDEGLPMSVLEAMAAGLPVVTTDVGGLPDLVRDGVHGRVVRPGDPAGLAAAILDLADDAEARRGLGAAGRERVRAHHAPEIVLPRLARLYETVAPRRGLRETVVPSP